MAFHGLEQGNVVRTWFGLFLFVLGCAGGASAQARTEAQSPRPLRPSEERERQEQPGARQGAVTTNEFDAQPKFSMDYFVGEWTFESNVSDTSLGSGGPVSGVETVRNVWEGRFWDITIKGEGPDGPFAGKGVIVYQDGFSGQSYARYEFTRGIGLLKTGAVGCDLGGTCSMYFETPPFEHNGSTIRLKGRYYLTSPFSYRVTSEVSVDDGPYRNLGTAWYTKNERVKPEPIR